MPKMNKQQHEKLHKSNRLETKGTQMGSLKIFQYLLLFIRKGKHGNKTQVSTQ